MNNFPAMTEEQRLELIAECEADISCARTLMIAAINVNDGETKAKWESQLLRQQVALAALTAKPVAYMYKDRLHSEPRFSSHTRFGNWSQEDINEYEITETKLYNSPPAPVLRGQELTVWYGAMPETNGKSNWTAILHRKGECISTGITIDRSEYPERVRYEADRMRYLIGELLEKPDILTYDANKHSGYKKPAPPEASHEQ
ncbi:hypothetical protein [Pantoea dispersa]|uniref:Uncharacterized protein n=1 Tax=Pantoea dispersa TaxID=59814 RepID=A0ABY3A076_9GAMM|nr:hypothetical protein [Pantoea dispersa]TQC75589.1 hypothetical protein FK492_06620 [Pantoea dispersa]